MTLEEAKERYFSEGWFEYLTFDEYIDTYLDEKTSES